MSHSTVVIRLQSGHCRCVAYTWPCDQHTMTTTPEGKIILGASCNKIATCVNTLSFEPINGYYALSAHLAVHQIDTRNCPAVLQLKTCEELGEVNVGDKTLALPCGCFVSLISCQDYSQEQGFDTEGYDNLLYEGSVYGPTANINNSPTTNARSSTSSRTRKQAVGASTRCAQACESCRQGKNRCELEQGNTKCKRCTKFGVECRMTRP